MYSKSYTDEIRARIEALPFGSSFTAIDFSDITDAHTVRRILKNLTDEGAIMRVMPGLFYKQKANRLLGEIVPIDPDDAAQTIARAYNWSIAPSGNTALNRLGLSTQVPAIWTYVSDGPYRDYEIDGMSISFKHSTNKNVTGMSPTTALVVQALKALGKNGITEKELGKVAKRLTAEEKRCLLNETISSTSWIRDAIRTLCTKEIAI